MHPAGVVGPDPCLQPVGLQRAAHQLGLDPGGAARHRRLGLQGGGGVLEGIHDGASGGARERTASAPLAPGPSAATLHAAT